MSMKQPSDSPEDSFSSEDQQKQIQELVQAFTKRTEAILTALVMGATFDEIEEYLDYLDETTSQTNNLEPG